MKSLLLIASFLVCLASSGQTYSPSTHTGLNKPVGVTNMPSDARSMFYDAANFKYRPYVSIAEALSYLNTTAKRVGGFPIIVNTGGTLLNGTITGGTNKEYWFGNCFADSCLVLKAGNDTTPLQVAPSFFNVNSGGALELNNPTVNVSSVSQIRAIPIVDTVIYRVVTNKDVYDFIPDRADVTTADDNFMTIVAADGTRLKRKVETYINLKWFAGTANIGDGIADSRPALLAAFQYAKNTFGAFTLFVPEGRYAIYNEVFFNFGVGSSVNIIGTGISGGRGIGSTFAWRGARGGTMFRFQGMYFSTIENIEFAGAPYWLTNSSPAKYLIHHQWAADALTSLVHYNKCAFSAWGGDSSAAVNFNATGGIAITQAQADESSFEECTFTGQQITVADSLKSWYGVLLGGNNTKDFSFTHNYWINIFHSAIKCSEAGGAGSLLSTRNLYSAVGWVFNMNKITSLTSINDYSEFTGGILKTPFSYTAYGNYNLISYEYFNGNTAGMIGGQPYFPVYPYIIDGGGNLVIQSSVFSTAQILPKINWTTNLSSEAASTGSATIIGSNFSNIKPGVTPFYSGGFPFFSENREEDVGRATHTNNQPKFILMGNTGMDSTNLVNNQFPDGSTSPFLEGGFFRTFTLAQKPLATDRNASIIRYANGDIVKILTTGDARSKIKSYVVDKAGMFKSYSATGTLTANSNIITAVSSTAGIEIGDYIIASAGWPDAATYPMTVSAKTSTTITVSQRFSQANGAVTLTNAIPVFRATGGATGTTAQRAALDTMLTANDIGYLYDNTTTGRQERWNGALFEIVGSNWSINGTSIYRSGGNVGIGVTGPLARLSFGTSAAGVDVINLFEDATIRYGMGVQANEYQQYAPQSAHFSWNFALSGIQTSGTNEYMRLNTTGLRIGTTGDPRGTLDVRGPFWLGVPGAVHGYMNSTDGMYFNADATGTGSSFFQWGNQRAAASGGNDWMRLNATGLTLNSLAGTGTRMVVSSSTGVLSTQEIPTGGGTATDTTSLSNRINLKENALTFKNSSVTTSQQIYSGRIGDNIIFRGIAGAGLVTSYQSDSILTINVPTSAGVPSQTGQAGKYLTTNGTTSSWATVSGGGGGATFPAQQTHTSGSAVTITNQTTDIWLLVDPASTLAALTITMPATPVDGQKIEVSFGGTLNSGTVITSLTLAANTGQAIHGVNAFSNIDAEDALKLRWKSSNSKWYKQ